MEKNKITAVLGPTNTGKTFYAIETMLAFESGMIGFPLRLLAREVYDKVIKRVSKNQVALITGEEKIIPPNSKYFLCTVESMPIDKSLDFVGIDEIQMCSDPERGHIFTDRLLNLRGSKLTMFMGSNTIKNLISSLREDVEFINKNRLSKLSYSGYKKISRIERKSAIIAFSSEDVYAIAELIRRQKGGAAIVMGSLSPKTRNSQVSLYQSGDVDYLVATDAIGMGINMDLDHVYFSNLKKFDGKKLRRLNLSEIGQISGRAGRHLNDGSFGITGECKDINADEVESLEHHKFDEIKTIYWRNSNLDFKNIERLILSLDEKPDKIWLRKINECEDEKVLKYLVKYEKLNIGHNEYQIKLLWECCQIPDFVKKTYGHHLEIVKKVFEFLSSNKSKISNQYMKSQLNNLDKIDGNIDSISNRIANVRTWSYVANKSNWVENHDYWIERTKYLEDKLSDRLHEELTKSFIDKRASVLAKGLKQDITFKTNIIDDEKVMINDQFIGSLKGLKLHLDLKIGALDADIKSLKKAARQNVAPEILQRINKIIEDKNLILDKNFNIVWNKNPIAKIVPGKDYLSPDINLIIDDMIEFSDQKVLIEFLSEWLSNKISDDLESLFKLKNIKNSNPLIRSLAYVIYENNGVVKREEISSLIKNLSKEDKKLLRGLGLKFGRYHVFLFNLFKPHAVSLRILLWKIFYQKYLNLEPPTFGLNFFEDNNATDKTFMLICGFEKFNRFFVRIDILERLFIYMVNSESEKNEIKVVPEMLNLLGCSKEKFLKLIKLMNYKYFQKENNTFIKYSPIKKKNNFKIRKDKTLKNNPFEILNQLNLK
ncbi:MAG: helicase [Candidatus Pelagibacter sp. TMED118]|nr:MAG: helicase [Candidatus Pelagibacter sp. TMED118]|tara:strand:- start:475 stop:2955 length:2481 start_codon:yes stop_codon:yes gene_type:complete